jgi:hypothetical protein
MKNVVGLTNAMRLVESACEKGEITIIGEGGLPSPVELYNKCVAFINKEYGVDILNLVAQTSMRKDCGDCCCDCCDDDDDQIVININGAREYLAKVLADLMPYADKDYLSEAIINIIDNFESANDNDEVKDMNTYDIIDIICDELCDRLEGVSLDTIKEVANVVGRHIESNYVLL